MYSSPLGNTNAALLSGPSTPKTGEVASPGETGEVASSGETSGEGASPAECVQAFKMLGVRCVIRLCGSEGGYNPEVFRSQGIDHRDLTYGQEGGVSATPPCLMCMVDR